MVRVTVFPVPRGMAVDEAWAEQEVMGKLVEYRWWKPRYRWPFVRWHVMKEEWSDAVQEPEAA